MVSAGGTPRLATPLHIVESYFDVQLERSALRRFDRVSDETWIAFAKHYLREMDAHFPAQFLSAPDDDQAQLRLFFEPRMAHAWDAAVRRLHAPTPLLGLSSDPGRASDIGRDDVSRMLTPLKKHLLVASSVYVRDSFYYCFDWVADSADETRWRQDPNTLNLVQESIRKLKAWLPILIELRALIESRALVFMPYYMTPSFPYGGDAPALKAAMQRISIRPGTGAGAPRPATPRIDFGAWRDPPPVVSQPSREYFSETEVLGAWLNSKLLGLDPVLPNRAMFDWAADLYLDEDGGAVDLTSDLISMDILPFGRAEGISLEKLLELRNNEQVFEEVRSAVVSCKQFIEDELGPGSSRAGVSTASREFLRERLAQTERRSLLRFVDDNPVAGVAVSVAIGAALVPVAPLISVLGGALLTPQLWLLAQRRRDPRRRAIGHLQALL